ncbi:ergot alkaloid biosynthesis protein [Nocardiopsis mangrovi]|uniref:Ergot alkaloid biosynthesis protein n=1 Tax=Nocardiopsis mangrovi TaxID=1179818 RepID=A0ABV9DVB7_9ACTN
MTTLVTGATGTTGSRVADVLERSGTTVRRVSRSSPVTFDWFDAATHDPAFDGVERLYLVAPVGHADPAAVVGPVLDRAVRRGVRRVALLSSSAVDRGASGLGRLHDLVLRVAPEPVVLRPSWFTQNFVSRAPGVRSLWSGEVATATGEGRVPFIDADDIAAVAAAALSGPVLPEPELVITGPQALTYDEVCGIWTRITGRPARHVRVSEEGLAARFTAAGVAAEAAVGLAALDGLIAADGQSTVTDTVATIAGRPARTVDETLAAALGPQRP